MIELERLESWPCPVLPPRPAVLCRVTPEAVHPTYTVCRLKRTVGSRRHVHLIIFISADKTASIFSRMPGVSFNL